MDHLSGMSAEAIADEMGILNQNKKTAEDKMDRCKAELARRGIKHVRGENFIVSVSETTSTRLDTEAMRADKKLAKFLPQFEKTSTSFRTLIKPVPKVVEVDK